MNRIIKKLRKFV